MTYEEIRQQAEKACEELIETAKLAEGDILVVGCSSKRSHGPQNRKRLGYKCGGSRI